MRDLPHDAGLPDAVPLFPLPNVVLFPRAVLPLHIFEERYKVMVADALQGDRRIAMALLRPGWERHYYDQAEIEPVVCVGAIMSHERLPDGRYNLLLQGRARARIVSESRVHCCSGGFYRLAEVEPLEEAPVLEIDLGDARRRLAELFEQPAYQSLPAGRQFQHLLAGPLPTTDISDLLAFNLFDCSRLKQCLLSEPDARRRVWRVIEVLESLSPQWRQVPENVHLN